MGEKLTPQEVLEQIEKLLKENDLKMVVGNQLIQSGEDNLSLLKQKIVLVQR